MPVRTGEAGVLVNELPSVKNLPAGVRQVSAGDAESITEMFNGFAIAVVGGLISSTFLSLLFIPPIFTIIDDVSSWASRRLGGVFAGQHSAQPTQTAPAE